MNDERIVYQGVKKFEEIGNSYFLVSVIYYQKLEFYLIKLHLPRSQKIYCSNFYESDFLNFELDFLEQEVGIEKINSFFSRKFSDFLDFTRNYEETSSNFSSARSFSYSQRRKSDMKVRKRIIFGNFIKSIEQFEQYNFQACKFWERLLRSAKLYQNQQGKYVLNINNYYGILRSTLFSEIVNIQSEEQALLQIFVENQKSYHHLSIKEHLKSVRIVDTRDFSCSVRIHFFNSRHSQAQKMFLSKILPLYYQ